MTYITIGYLPLGFIAVRRFSHTLDTVNNTADAHKSLFSMGHDIMPHQASTTLFAILISVSVLGTYGLAFSLQRLIKILDYLVRWMKGLQSKKPQIARMLSNQRDAQDKQGCDSRNVNDGSTVSGGNPSNNRGFLRFRRPRRPTDKLDSTEKAVESG